MNEDMIRKLLEVKGYKLLGQIPVSEEEYEKLLSYTKSKIKYLYMSSIPTPDLMLSVALVQVAIRRYQEGRFWGCFRSEIGNDVSGAKLNYLGQIFIKTLRYYNLFELENENSTQEYVENIKAHAFVTNYYMHGFFDFSYAFYENNLFRELSDSVEEDIDALVSFMASTLANDKDAFVTDKTSTRAAKSYKLLKSTRAVFAYCPFSCLVSQFYPILELIDKYYYDGEVPTLPSNRYEWQFIEWCQNRQIIEKNKKKHRNTTRHLSSHRPYMRVDVEAGMSMVVIPPQKFRDEDCDGYVDVTVTINGHSEKRELEVYRSFGIYITEEYTIPIPSIFEGIEVVVSALIEKTTIFKKSNYRLFDLNWESTSRFVRGQNYLLVKPKIDVRWEKQSDVIDSEVFYNWQFFSVFIDEESICYVGNTPVSLIGEYSAEPVFDSTIDSYIVFDSDGKELLASREHPGISFVVGKHKVNGTILLVNNQKIAIKEIKEKTSYEWPEDKSKVAISLSLSSVLPQKDGVYRVYLDVPGESVKKLCEYVLLKSLRCKTEEKMYVYKHTGWLRIKKGGLSVHAIDMDWGCIEESSDVVLYEFPINDDTSEVSFICELGEEDVRVSCPVHIFKYGFSKMAMSIGAVDYLWHTDIGENLYLQLFNATNVAAYWMKEKHNLYYAEEIEDGIYRIDISEMVRNIKNTTRVKCQYINIHYNSNGNRKNIALPPVLRVIVVEPYFKIQKDEKGIYMDFVVMGRADLLVTITDHFTNEVVVSRRRVQSGKNYFPEMTEEGSYDIKSVMEESDDFGFDVMETELKSVYSAGYLNYSNLTGCRLQIKTVFLDEEELRFEYLYYVELWEKIGADEYKGVFFRAPIVGKKVEWREKKSFGTAKVFVYQKEEIIKFSLLMYSKDEEEWMAPYYDKQRKIILGCDNRLVLTAKDYERFIPMEEDYTEYIVDMTRIRRIR